ncbi:MAG: peptidoglycan DD-metalloendopeptidase family protein [Anaerolineales bacterium]|nr:peptidoglycan DD-metalloendopeptidase family protein [Anaerolineales bacterium]
MIVRYKQAFQIIVLFALLTSLMPGSVSALAVATPPVDMFQWPWQQGEAWIAMDGFDNGTRRLPSSPHNYKIGGAVDFAPHVNMKIGEDTSNFWVTAAAAGTIIEKSTCHVKIDHGNGWITEYWHLDNLQVAFGAAVYRNQRLGVIADSKYQKVCTGNEYPGPHLHFVMRPKMKETIFSGWIINYNVVTNKTTFTKAGQTLGSYVPILNVPNLQIVLRDPITWDIVYKGSVDAYRYERWPFQLSEPTKFTVTATATTSGLSPVVVLLDANGNEISRASNILTSTQPAGNYFVQIQPEAGNGFYNLLLHKEDISEPTPTPLPTEPSVSTVVIPTSINAGETVSAAVNLNNIPVDGYTSTEFTCTYNPVLVGVSNIVVAGLFGTDPVTAINGPQNGTFIVAIAGSNGNRATVSGTAFTFGVTGLQDGETTLKCTARISKGDKVLSDILSIGDSLTVVGNMSTAPTLIPVTPTPISTQNPNPSPPTIAGQVLASKPVTVSLYNADNSLAASVAANPDGTFNLVTSAGTYTVIATADGFLNAQGSATLTVGNVVTMPVVSLIAGDIDGNGVIDQYDALTVGMSYNTALPASADLNADGVINVLDLEILARNYRRSGALAW